MNNPVVSPFSLIPNPSTDISPAQLAIPQVDSTLSIVRGATVPSFLRDECLADIFEATAHTYPDQIALTFGCKRLTYAELNTQADLLADRLLAKGVKSGQLVGLWQNRGLDLLISQLAIAKTGAGWLPMDADIPPERIMVCLEDAHAVGLITSDELKPVVAEVLASLPVELWTVESLRASMPDKRDYPPQNWLRRGAVSIHDPAYVIYTSGSTGKPKGILLSQGSICHFLRSENGRLGINANDKVYQGFSVAFDMSFEEIWISYLVGASLWIAPKAIVADPEALYQALSDNQITVLHAVPTLVALLPDDVPSIRIMNLGGEMCPDAVVRRFAKPENVPNRQLFNTYGPTEATVSASLALLKPNEPVTIGIPLPNYGMLVRGENGEILPINTTGELCIFGRAVAIGYLGRPELTAEKFIDNPVASNDDEKILYRTGDLAKIDAFGNIFMFGRADDQIKIRGFRVELGEIESALVDIDNIGTSAVVLRLLNDVDQLVAFVVADDADKQASSDGYSQQDLRHLLRQRLPSYMMPARFEWLTDSQVPRLASGKIDRKVLKAMPLADIQSEMQGDEPADEAETLLFDKLRTLLGVQQISLKADFFDDLGGHSLLVAKLISQLRQVPQFSHLTIADIYQARTVIGIADKMRIATYDNRGLQGEHAKITRYSASFSQRLVATLVQTAYLPFIIMLQIMKWLAPFFVYNYFTGSPGDSILTAIVWSLLTFLAVELLGFMMAIVGNRLLIARVTAGRYPLWGSVYLRWWLADRLTDLAPSYLLAGSSLYVSYLRALGAKVGNNVNIGSITIRNPHLLSIGNNVDIGNGVNLDNAYVEKGWLHLGQIALGNDTYVGSYSVLEGNTTMADGSYLDGLAAVVSGMQLPANTAWQGAPLQPTNKPEPMPASQPQNIGMRLHLYYLLGMVLVACLFYMPIFPTFIMVDAFDEKFVLPFFQAEGYHWTMLRYFILAIPGTAIMIFLTVLVSAAIRWLAVPKLQAGMHPVHGSLYRRKWLANLIQESSLQTLHGIYATVYAPYWYRLLGAKVGKNAEISTAMGVVPDMLTLGDDSFIADAVMLGDEEIRQGWMHLKPTVVGSRSFVGNGAYVPDGSQIPDDVLIGVQSRVPTNEQMQQAHTGKAMSDEGQGQTPQGQTWFGTPAIRLPARETIIGYDPKLTFAPSTARFISRAFIEGLRIVLPLSFIIGVGYSIVELMLDVEENYDTAMAILALLGCGVLYGLGSIVFVALLKWLLVGKYRPRSAPMWTLFVWISEAITSLYEAIVIPSINNYLRGTVYLPWVMRLFGAKIGRRAWLDSTDMTEFDCVTLGDDCELNNHTGPQTHLFEDRIMKIGTVKLGNGVTVRSRSTVLYDTQIHDNVIIEPMTLVMKGEELPSDSIWSGSPAVSVSKQ